MTPKIIAIAAILATAAMLAGMVSTIPITAASSEESETESNLKCKGSGHYKWPIQCRQLY